MKSIILFLEQTHPSNPHLRSDIKLNQKVLIVQKQHQKQNILTQGIILKILTSKSKHTRGIKVKLKSGEVGRVQKILS